MTLIDVPKDLIGKPLAWIYAKCVICKKPLCKMMTAEVENTPMIICRKCFDSKYEK